MRSAWVDPFNLICQTNPKLAKQMESIGQCMAQLAGDKAAEENLIDLAFFKKGLRH